VFFLLFIPLTPRSGNAFYVEMPKNQEEEFRMTYDYPEFTEAFASDMVGDTISLTARYNRRSAAIEIILEEELREIDGAQIPVIFIGSHTYIYMQQGDEKGISGSFGKLAAQSPDGQYAAAYLYTVKQASNIQPQRGISSQKPKTLSLDSTAYLLGLRPLAVQLPRNKTKLIKDLNACERTAFESLKKYKPRKATYLQELCEVLSADCSKKEEAELPPSN